MFPAIDPLFAPMDDFVARAQNMELQSQQQRELADRLDEDIAQQRADYQTRISKLLTDREQLLAENSKLQGTLGNSHALGDRLGKDLGAQREHFERQIQQLLQERDALAKQNFDLQNGMRIKDDELQEAKLDRDAIKDTMIAQSEQFDKMGAEFEKRFQTERDQWQREKTFMCEQFEKEARVLREAAENADIIAENDLLAEKLQALARAADSIQRQLRDEIQKVSREFTIEQSRRVEAEAMAERLMGEIEDLKIEHRNKLHELSEMVAFLKDELSTLKKTYMLQIQTLELKITDIKAEKERLGVELNNQRDLYEKQITSLTKQRDDFKTLCGTLKEDLKIKQDEIIVLANHMEAEIARLSQEKQRYWVKLQEKTSESRDLKERLQKQKMRFKNQAASLTESFEKRINAITEQKNTEIVALEAVNVPLMQNIDALVADKSRLIMEVAEVRSKCTTFQEEIVLLRQHVIFVGKMWNQLTEQLVEDKTHVEMNFRELQKVLNMAKEAVVAHEVENTRNVCALKDFSSRFLCK